VGGGAPTPNPQSPIPNPQSPIPNIEINKEFFEKLKIKIYLILKSNFPYIVKFYNIFN